MTPLGLCREAGGSRLNLVRRLPRLTELRVYDNSKDGDPASGIAPAPVLVLHTARGRVITVMEVDTVPEWAKPIVAAALRTPGPSKTHLNSESRW